MRKPRLVLYLGVLVALAGVYLVAAWIGMPPTPLRNFMGIVAGAGLLLAAQRMAAYRSLQKNLDELRRQKEILQAIFDHIPVMIGIIDRTGQFQRVNRHWQDVLGWSLEEARDRDLFVEFYPDPAYRRQVLEFIQRAGAGGWSDFNMRVRDGRIIHTTWANMILSDGTIIGIGRDITEQKQAEDTLRHNTERLQALSNRLLEVQETERRHLAGELHDEIGQLLTGMKYALASTGGPPEMVAAKIQEARALIDEALTAVRRLSFNLRPALLDHFGLLPALRSLIEHFTASTGVRVNYQHAGLEARFASGLETAAYRIVQEALTNVARHSEAHEAVVRVWVTVDALEIQVEDAGVGFDQHALWVGRWTSGLSGMYERVRLLGGRLTIDSAPGAGTHLLAQLPLQSGGPTR